MRLNGRLQDYYGTSTSCSSTTFHFLESKARTEESSSNTFNAL